MIYRPFQNTKLSSMAMGCMRLPVIDGDDANIDAGSTQEMIDYAYAQGVNYFDTAWGYHGGNSEKVVGQCLSKYPRESYYLATKFPGYDLSNHGKAGEIFDKQLEKCGVDYFDFYLFHNVCEMNIDAYLDPKYGTKEAIVAKRDAGAIKHIGFSAHGSLEVIDRFLEGYGDVVEFCQIQLNYMDYEFQDAKAKVDRLSALGIPVWVMEPLRGGGLAKLEEAEEAALKALRPDESVVAWAYRFLQSLPQVTTVLSGSSTLEQLKENIACFAEDKPLSAEEMDALLGIARNKAKNAGVPCTACRYCTSYCPIEIDIPRLLELYNEHKFTGGGFIAPMALMAIDSDKQPESCIACGSCAAVCPQQIDIPQALADFAKLLGR